MDRSKWEYKKLGEVCNLYQPKTISSDMLIPDGKYLVYGANGVIGKYNEYNHENSEVLMTCRGATCGTINVSAPYSWINGNAMVVHPRINDLSAQFLVYQLKAADKTSVITGAAQPQITRQMLQTLPFIVAPIADQQRIVAELDCLNEMIALKQEQLKEFDKLAQSIFHDMFGDSVINSKGWPTDKIENVISEKSYRGTINNEDGQVWLLNLDMVESNTGRILEKLFVSTEKTDGSVTTFNEEYVLYSKLRPYLNKVVLPDSSGYCTTELVTLLPNKDKLNRYYVAYLLRSESFVNYICGKVAGAKMPRVSMKEFRTFSIPLPPLALQQQFVEKIQAIEVQKELVKKSIAETQQLLDSRMDYYFD